MKKIFGYLAVGVLTISSAACAKATDTETQSASSPTLSETAAPLRQDTAPKVLVAYFSHSGNTEAVARQIAAKTGGDLYEIKTVHAYAQNYHELLDQAKEEIRSGALPPLAGSMPDISRYNVIFVGTPNWWGGAAPAVLSFLKQNDFHGKTVIPFNTNGGGGMQNCEKDMRAALSGVNVAEGAAFAGRPSGAPENALNKWLERLGFER